MSGTYDFVAAHLNPENAPAIPETLADYFYLVTLAREVEGYHPSNARFLARMGLRTATLGATAAGTVFAAKKSNYPLALGLGVAAATTAARLSPLPLSVVLAVRVNKRRKSQTLNLVPSTPEARDVVLASIMAAVRDYRKGIAAAGYVVHGFSQSKSLDDTLTSFQELTGARRG